MNIQINSLTNANIYIDGVGLLGRADEIEIANPKHTMIDYKGLGMAGTAELWAGVETLESTIKWTSFDATTLTMSTSPFQTHPSRRAEIWSSTPARDELRSSRSCT